MTLSNFICTDVAVLDTKENVKLKLSRKESNGNHPVQPTWRIISILMLNSAAT